MSIFMFFIAPALLGFASYWMSGKCKGKNAKNFFKFAAWGFWLWYLYFIPGPFLFPFSILNWFIKLAPMVIAFFLAINSILKEMRAQKQGEYTEAA